MAQPPPDRQDKPATGFPEPVGSDPRYPPDPDGEPFGEEPHPPTGSTSTSKPHPSQDPEAEPWEGPECDRIDR